MTDSIAQGVERGHERQELLERIDYAAHVALEAGMNNGAVAWRDSLQGIQNYCRSLLEAALSAPTVGMVEEAVTIPKRLYDFLMGEGLIDDIGFGEMHEGLPGAFWWRALLMTGAKPLATPPSDAVEAERERCAKIAENPCFIEAQDTDWDLGFNFAKETIAAAIRASSPAR